MVASGFLDRTSERATLDGLLARVREGQSSVLVMRGEAGIGKTALLQYAARHASGFHVVPITSVEAEMELPFAGIHQLCAPLLDRLDTLPQPQQDALNVALGLAAGDVPSRFLVGLAVLGLLSAAAEEQPLLCLVEDSQWLDDASGLILGFIARRLLAESVAMVVTVREPTTRRDFDGLPELVLRGLADEDARTLLVNAVPGRLDDGVRDRIVAETGGNPLALLDLPRSMSPTELAGGFELLPSSDLPRQLEDRYLQRVGDLPEATQRLLLLAAAEPIGDAALLWRAADRLGLETASLAPAEDARLVEVGARVRFRHPLVRSAVYRAAAPSERRAAHRALAEATDPDADPDRRAWHRARAAVGVDEAVAAELERSADRAQARGGSAAAAAFLTHATELTPDPAERGRRALAAARANLESGAPDAAHELLTAAEACPLDENLSAWSTRLRAEIVFARTRGSDAPPLLLDAAERFEAVDSGSARETYLEALGAAIFSGRLSGRVGVREAAEAARGAPAPPRPPRATDLLLDGLVTRFTDGYVGGLTPLRRALNAFVQDAPGNADDVMRWFWLPWLVAGDLWDDELWHALATRAVRLGRESGALNVLPLALGYRAVVHLQAGELAEASALTEEADAITRATGNAPVKYASLLLAAWRGVEAEALEQLGAGLDDAAARGEGRGISGVSYATAVLYNGLGRYDAALASARSACEHDDLGVLGFSLVEVVEAGARCGAHEEAGAALERLAERTGAAETDWALGIEARSRALVCDGEAAESLYREAIERLEPTRIVVDLARARLLYGEWLRRDNRRVDARAQLRAADDLFSDMGAAAFSERARRELRATGETARSRTDETRGVLTPQEAQIAQLARDGYSNPDIGAQLFISPRTVQYHLRKVFLKLEITSRNELGRLPGSRLSSA
jgi:DNA-binding CsgD family transcriptional regulator